MFCFSRSSLLAKSQKRILHIQCIFIKCFISIANNEKLDFQQCKNRIVPDQNFALTWKKVHLKIVKKITAQYTQNVSCTDAFCLLCFHFITWLSWTLTHWLPDSCRAECQCFWASWLIFQNPHNIVSSDHVTTETTIIKRRVFSYMRKKNYFLPSAIL